jgi:hypothetical protein
MNQEITRQNEESDDDDNITKNRFSDKIRKVVLLSKGSISFIEATVHTAEYYQIDLSNGVQKYLTDEIKNRIELEANELRLLKRSNRERSKDNLLCPFMS